MNGGNDLNSSHSNGSSNNNKINPYVHYSAVPTSTSTAKGPMGNVLDALSQCGKKVEVATKRAEAIRHCRQCLASHSVPVRMSPSFAEAAMARLNQGTKALTAGGLEKVFQQAFDNMPGEKLLHSYACYLSTSHGPVIGTLYISNKRIAFCSDFGHYLSPGNPTFVHYKVVVRLDQLRAVNPSASRWNPSEKYIQIVTKDGHEFWFMGFISYDKALKNLRQALSYL